MRARSQALVQVRMSCHLKQKDLPVSKGRSSDLEIACFAARRASGAMEL